jgi:hypothetical protein
MVYRSIAAAVLMAALLTPAAAHADSTAIRKKLGETPANL